MHVESWLIGAMTKAIEADETIIERFKNVAGPKFPPKVFVNIDEETRMAIDNIITMGGDGTVLTASKQFHGHHCPPMITFHMESSLCFLAHFKFDTSTLDRVVTDMLSS